MTVLKRRNGKINGEKKTGPPSLNVIQIDYKKKEKSNANPLDLQTPEEWKEEQLEPYRIKLSNKKLKTLPWEKVAQAIIDCDGYVMKTAIKLGCSYALLAKIIKENPKLKGLIKDATEALLDLSENKLRDLILAGDKTAIIFHLKSKGRHRGWLEDGATQSEEELPVQFVYETVIPQGAKIVFPDREEKKVGSS